MLPGFSFSVSLPNPPVPLDWIVSFTQPSCKRSYISFLSRHLQMHRPFILPLAFSKLQTYLTCGPKTLQIRVPFPQTPQILPNAENDITTTSCTQWMTSLPPHALNEWHHYHFMRAVMTSLPPHACSEWNHYHLMHASWSLNIILSTPSPSFHPLFSTVFLHVITTTQIQAIVISLLN